MTVVPFPHEPATTSEARPKVLHAYRRHAPKKAPCPHCGQLGRRKDYHYRTVRSSAYQAILLVHVTTAEYRATCSCCTTFRTQIDGIEPKAHYHTKVREAVLDRILDDRMSLRLIQQAMQRDFLLDLSDGFLYDCLDWKIRQLNGAVYRQWTLTQFSGTLCIDEIHLGEHTLLLATDPLADFPVAFALVSRNDQAHLDRFLRPLAAHGFMPQVVVTDGSSLYPSLLAVIWPLAEHQLCIFHVEKDINELVLDAARRIRREMARRGRRGRKRRRGRPQQGSKARRQRQTLKEQAKRVFKGRYLIVKRRDRLTAGEQHRLAELLQVAPGLRPLREFVDAMHQLFECGQSEATAWRRHTVLLNHPAYRAVPELVQALAMLPAEKFTKMIAFLRSPVGSRVRTNNHVERMNRVLRLYEKSRYKWRRARTKVRFVWLLVERRWGPLVQEWAAGRGRRGGGVAPEPPPRPAEAVGPPPRQERAA